MLQSVEIPNALNLLEIGAQFHKLVLIHLQQDFVKEIL